eukprot:scaffold870_cov268-Pinguiococcus_pyrenoidosus.AAC.35
MAEGHPQSTVSTNGEVPCRGCPAGSPSWRPSHPSCPSLASLWWPLRASWPPALPLPRRGRTSQQRLHFASSVGRCHGSPSHHTPRRRPLASRSAFAFQYGGAAQKLAAPVAPLGQRRTLGPDPIARAFRPPPPPSGPSAGAGAQRGTAAPRQGRRDGGRKVRRRPAKQTERSASFWHDRCVPAALLLRPLLRRADAHRAEPAPHCLSSTRSRSCAEE